MGKKICAPDFRQGRVSLWSEETLTKRGPHAFQRPGQARFRFVICFIINCVPPIVKGIFAVIRGFSPPYPTLFAISIYTRILHKSGYLSIYCRYKFKTPAYIAVQLYYYPLLQARRRCIPSQVCTAFFARCAGYIHSSSSARPRLRCRWGWKTGIPCIHHGSCSLLQFLQPVLQVHDF